MAIPVLEGYGNLFVILIMLFNGTLTNTLMLQAMNALQVRKLPCLLEADLKPHPLGADIYLTEQNGAIMKKYLPDLNEELLNMVFEHFEDCVNMNCSKPAFENGRLNDFFEILKAMQLFNYRHRLNDIKKLFSILEPSVFSFKTNTDGPMVWVALILAIKELYGFPNKQLISVVKQITISNSYCCPVL